MRRRLAGTLPGSSRPTTGQLRLDVYTDLSSGANMVEYWHWHSIHAGQETYWKGVLSHDLEPNRAYAEVSRIAHELQKVGPEIVNLQIKNQVAILYSVDSSNAISFMPFRTAAGSRMGARQSRRRIQRNPLANCTAPSIRRTSAPTLSSRRLPISRLTNS